MTMLTTHESRREFPGGGKTLRHLLTIAKNSGMAIIYGAWGILLICAKSHLFPKDWRGPALFLLIVSLMVMGAVLELLRINKKDRRRKRLAKAFGIGKKSGKHV